MARIGISAEFIRPGRVGGTEQALQYSIDGLIANLASDDEIVIFGRETPFVDGPQLRISDPPHPVQIRFIQETFTYRANARLVDTYFFPNYFTPPGRRTCRRVTTIPDLQYLHLPANFSAKKRIWLRQAHRHTLRAADVVTVYSDFVRDDIAEHYGERAEERVEVIPIPVSWERFGDAIDEHAGAPSWRPYVLGVSSHYMHKNLATLLRAFRRVRAEMPDLGLILVGQLGSNLAGVRQAEDIPKLIDELGLDATVRATGYIDPLELGALYRGAELFVFPSVFEGFGLPPVEALGFGLPVITTDRTSLPQVTRGLADLVTDPFDDEELSSLMLQRLRDRNRPTDAEVAEFRKFYAPERIGRELYRVLVDQA